MSNGAPLPPGQGPLPSSQAARPTFVTPQGVAPQPVGYGPRQNFPSLLAQPLHVEQALVPPAAPAPSLPPMSVGIGRGRGVAIWLWPVLAVFVLLIVAYFLTFLGPAASVIGLVAATVPFVAVVATMLWVDRWEPEPKRLVVFALLWGAVVSVSVALGMSFLTGLVIHGPLADAFFTVVQAPIVEEVIKGLGILVVFAMARRAFDGPVDGIIYGALVGAGFAFVENIQYFAVAVINGGAQELGFTFLLRGLMSPFAHAMFTAATGFALGLAARRGLTAGRSIGPFLLGLLVAILLHGYWNGVSLFVGSIDELVGVYVLTEVPIFVICIIVLVRMRREEERLTKARLADYAQAGWFTGAEVDMLATPRGRRTGRAWARTLRGDRTAYMKRFISDSTLLAATRHRILTGRDPLAAFEEQHLLQRIVAERQALLAP